MIQVTDYCMCFFYLLKFLSYADDSPFALQIMNKAFFKLSSDGTHQPEDTTAQEKDSVPQEVMLNKPFLLAVFEAKSRAMLFLGRVTNPLQQV